MGKSQQEKQVEAEIRHKRAQKRSPEERLRILLDTGHGNCREAEKLRKQIQEQKA